MPLNNNSNESEVPATPALSAPDFFIHTSPEMDALERAAADGKHGRHYQNLAQEPARVHQVKGASHFVRLDITDAEQRLGATSEFLETLTKAQDADSALAFLYISRLLAPPSPLPANTAATGKIDFDDVIDKIGWDPRSGEERREMHKRLYHFIQFGERAQVIGTRRGKYVDRHTGKEIPTTIRSAIWRIIKTETPEQQSLYPEFDAPVSVDLVIGHEWSELLTSPQTAQYLPMGELLGRIPGNKPSGAWARAIGLSLASFWRRNPKESMEGTIRPTRRELLDRYTPKTGSAIDLINSPNIGRAIPYWCGAMKALVEGEFIENLGEALASAEEMRKSLPRKNWGEDWLNATVDIRPATGLRDKVKQRAVAVEKRPKKHFRAPRKKTP